MLNVALEKKNYILSRITNKFDNSISLDKVYSEVVTKFYPIGNIIYNEKDIADKIYIVIKGEVSLEKTDISTKKSLKIIICSEGDVLGLESLSNINYFKCNSKEKKSIKIINLFKYKNTVMSYSTKCVVAHISITNILKNQDVVDFLLNLKKEKNKIIINEQSKRFKVNKLKDYFLKYSKKEIEQNINYNSNKNIAKNNKQLLIYSNNKFNLSIKNDLKKININAINIDKSVNYFVNLQNKKKTFNETNYYKNVICKNAFKNYNMSCSLFKKNKMKIDLNNSKNISMIESNNSLNNINLNNTLFDNKKTSNIIIENKYFQKYNNLTILNRVNKLNRQNRNRAFNNLNSLNKTIKSVNNKSKIKKNCFYITKSNDRSLNSSKIINDYSNDSNKQFIENASLDKIFKDKTFNTKSLIVNNKLNICKINDINNNYKKCDYLNKNKNTLSYFDKVSKSLNLSNIDIKNRPKSFNYNFKFNDNSIIQAFDVSLINKFEKLQISTVNTAIRNLTTIEGSLGLPKLEYSKKLSKLKNDHTSILKNSKLICNEINNNCKNDIIEKIIINKNNFNINKDCFESIENNLENEDKSISLIKNNSHLNKENLNLIFKPVYKDLENRYNYIYKDIGKNIKLFRKNNITYTLKGNNNLIELPKSSNISIKRDTNNSISTTYYLKNNISFRSLNTISSESFIKIKENNKGISLLNNNSNTSTNKYKDNKSKCIDFNNLIKQKNVVKSLLLIENQTNNNIRLLNTNIKTTKNKSNYINLFNPKNLLNNNIYTGKFNIPLIHNKLKIKN